MCLMKIMIWKIYLKDKSHIYLETILSILSIFTNLMYLFIFKIIIKLIITSSRFNPGSTLVRPQKPLTSLFYGSLNGLCFKTLVVGTIVFHYLLLVERKSRHTLYLTTFVKLIYLISHRPMLCVGIYNYFVIYISIYIIIGEAERNSNCNSN